MLTVLSAHLKKARREGPGVYTADPGSRLSPTVPSATTCRAMLPVWSPHCADVPHQWLVTTALAVDDSAPLMPAFAISRERLASLTEQLDSDENQ